MNDETPDEEMGEEMQALPGETGEEMEARRRRRKRSSSAHRLPPRVKSGPNKGQFKRRG